MKNTKKQFGAFEEFTYCIITNCCNGGKSYKASISEGEEIKKNTVGAVVSKPITGKRWNAFIKNY